MSNVTRKALISLIFGFLMTMLSVLYAYTYTPSPPPRMPIQMTYRGYPFPWIIGAGNPGEKPLIWSFQWLNLGLDLVIWTFIVLILQSVKDLLKRA